MDVRPLVRFCKPPPVLATFLDINECYDYHRGEANRETEWESHPVVLGLVYYCLDDEGADY